MGYTSVMGMVFPEKHTISGRADTSRNDYQISLEDIIVSSTRR
jgi:hypothetical protein